MKQSIINWQTGEPKESCSALISVRNRKGEVFTATDSWNIYYKEWSIYNWKRVFMVIAWCKLSDIEPYKEE